MVRNNRICSIGLMSTHSAAADDRSLEWLTMDDDGDVVLTEEPDVTPLMRLQNMLLAPFVPEQELSRVALLASNSRGLPRYSSASHHPMSYTDNNQHAKPLF